MSTGEDAAFEQIKKGVVKRSQRRVLGVFIDGVGLDRACRRLNKRVDFAALIRGISGGLEPTVARYYSIIPFEDDSRHHAFFDVVSSAGLDVVIKRLPPKGVDRLATIDIEMTADMIAFSKGHTQFDSGENYLTEEYKVFRDKFRKDLAKPKPDLEALDGKKVIVTVCPSRELSYAMSLAKEFGADTVTADFATHSAGNVLKSAAKFIDLSDSKSIWMEG